MKDKKHHIDLSKTAIKAPFEVEEGYFNDLPQRVQAKMSQPEYGLSFGAFWKLGLSGTVALLAIIMFFVNTPDVNDNVAGLASVTNEELMAYMQEEEISETDFYDLEDAVELALANNLSFNEVELITVEEIESVIDDPIYDEDFIDEEEYLEDLEIEDLESLSF